MIKLIKHSDNNYALIKDSNDPYFDQYISEYEQIDNITLKELLNLDIVIHKLISDLVNTNPKLLQSESPKIETEIEDNEKND